ncbi:hypothetical protein [Paenibacillus sp. sgz302251]|uniref:hypothetical protein n=1 Tax=Paenibacillus sp. sgz302251 TaxID=3414493 RepID=UPI003C7DEB19
MKLNVSDWVQGKTHEGELIHGFIETIDILQGIVTVNVVKSDNEVIIGKIVAVRENWLRRVPDITLEDAQLAQNLIDMALATWDEAWFMELTGAQESSVGDRAATGSRQRSNSFPHNRLGSVGR